MLGRILYNLLLKPAFASFDPVTMAVVGGAAGGGLGFLSGKKGSRDPYGTLNPEQKQLTQALGPYLQGQMGEPKLYSGQMTEPISAGEEQMIGSSNRLGALSETGYADLMNPDLNTYNKQFDEWMANPQYSTFRRNVLPGIQEAMPTFSTAMGEATKRGYQDVTDRLSQQRYEGWQAAQNRRLSALGQAPTSMAQYAQTAGIPRTIKQAGLDRQYAEWTRGQQDRQDSINKMLQFLNISTVTETPDTRFQNAMAGLQAGAGIGLGISSAQNTANFQKQYMDYLNKQAPTMGGPVDYVPNVLDYGGYNRVSSNRNPTPINYRGTVIQPGVPPGGEYYGNGYYSSNYTPYPWNQQ